MNKKLINLLIPFFIYVLLISFVLHNLISCSTNTKPANFTNVQNEIKTVTSWISPQWPKSNQQYKTTHSTIFISNLQSSIAVFKKLYSKTKKPIHGAQLAQKMYFRYRVLGDFNDAVNALNLINKLVEEQPKTPSIYLIHATILSGFHEFDKAIIALETAKQYGMKQKAIQKLKQEILFSLGQYEDYKTVISKKGNNLNKAKYALLNNHFKQASYYYKLEMDTYRDTDPFKLAWLQLQQGIAFLRYGKYDTAKLFFETAHKRFPKYYLVTEHLAESEFLLGNFEKARKLYQQVSKQTQNPEFFAQLAKIELKLKHPQKANMYLTTAKNKFDNLTQKFPKATGDHALQFYLNNKQEAKALNLAQININNRKNIESYLLLAKAAKANHLDKLEKKALKLALKLKAMPIELLAFHR